MGMNSSVVPSTSPRIRAENVTVVRGGRTILDDVSLDLPGGDVVAVVGPNGAGKSTLLAVLAGDLDPVRGSVTLDGRALGTIPHHEQALRRAVLLQEHTVSFPFTVREVVEMGRHAHRSPRRRRRRDEPRPGGQDHDAADRDEAVVRRCLEDTDLVGLAHREITTLSGGERARAALARVLAQDTPVLLLDEPTASLDLRHQEQVLQLGRRRADAGVAVLVVMHDLGLAAAHADRIVVLHGGRVRADGPPTAVLTQDLLGEVYGLAVEVWSHPRTGHPMVLPHREAPDPVSPG
jgi:iron complex transport system ATP-binding protein